MKTLAVCLALSFATPAMAGQVYERYTTGTAKIIDIQPDDPERLTSISDGSSAAGGTYVYDLWGNPIYVPPVTDYEHQGPSCDGFLVQSGPQKGRCFNAR